LDAAMNRIVERSVNRRSPTGGEKKWGGGSGKGETYDARRRVRVL
jgi:hypothetical protein